MLTKEFVLEPSDNHRLASLCGQFDENLRHIERSLHVDISNRGCQFQVSGDDDQVTAAVELLRELYDKAASNQLTSEDLHLYLQESDVNERVQSESTEMEVSTRKATIKARGKHQKEYIHRIRNFDLNFGIGPAGTGKTYLAVACAVEALESERVRRLVLVRPAVEAGERLGFLPGDLAQKVDPYLRPLYDALYEMLGFERVARLIDRNVIEIAPLAYMRGRTLNHAFIIMDEAQNTTREQMKMFLTRIGFGSTAVVTGDITQTDLPDNKQSGLQHATQVLKTTTGISFTNFDTSDVVRHPLVKRIVAAYESQEK